MDAKETIKLVKAIEGILENINDKGQIGVAIRNYLYLKGEKKVLIPQSLWNIIICLDKELAEREFGERVVLNYHLQLFDNKAECHFQNYCESCWMKDTLVFAVDAGMCIEIAEKPKESINCGGAGAGNPVYQFCAVCLRRCLYRYMTSSECYIPKNFFRWEMFVFFLFSFDAFYVCFEYCIKNNNQSLNQIHRDVLEIVFGYKEVSEEQLEDCLSDDKSESAEFLKCILRNCQTMEGVGHRELYSVLGNFNVAMKNRRRQVIALLRDNQEKAKKIIGEELTTKMIAQLSVDWLGSC